jgi:DNA-binding SARP family transcriptional activator/Tfp pilus assembly protein PilF
MGHVARQATTVHPAGGGLAFRLLGDFEASIGGHPIDLGTAKQRCVLAVLLVDANRVVPVDQLLDRVWGERRPQRARAALAAYASRLRHALAAAGEISLAWRSGGYVLTVDPAMVDVHRFRDLVARTRSAEDQVVLGLLDRALGLWRGEAFGTLTTPWLESVRESLNAERHAAELDRNDLGLAAGRHASLLGDLTERAAAFPLDERLAAQLLLALYRCGRQADALQHYERLRVRLADELGADPSAALALLHKRMLTADPALAWSEQRPPTPVPRQLPVVARTFTGRARELHRLDTILADRGERPTAVVISAISGMAGIGKTTLAVHWAHQVAHQFPDGQMFVNLRGFDPGGRPVSHEEALRGFLDALAVSAQRIPSSLDGKIAIYRSLLADRRMLIVLDNARDAEHVRPLLPGAPGCLVVVTSRHQLTGLVASEGAHPLTLDLFGPADARELLARHIGADRVAGEPEAVSQIISRCAQLPLALSTVAARAAFTPNLPLAAVARELRDTRPTLDALAGLDPATDVRTVLSWSLNAVGAAAARLFRLLGLHPGPDIGAPAAASLAGLPPAQVGPLLAELIHAHLLTEHRPGRFALHDLVRAHAYEQANARDSDRDRHRAGRRMLDHYLHTAYAADRLINPTRTTLATPAEVEAGVTLEQLEDADRATAWLSDEHRVLLAVTHYAAGTGFDTHAWQLAWAFATFLSRRGFWHDQIASQRIALEAARRLADPGAEGYVRRTLANTYVWLGRYDDAYDHLRHALEIADAHGDTLGEAYTRIAFGWILGKQGRYAEALPQDQRAFESFRDVGDPGGQARALSNMAWHRAQLGDYGKAVPTLHQALALHRGTRDTYGTAAVLDTLGFIHYRVGQHMEAIDVYRQAIELCRAEGLRRLEAEILAHLGDCHNAFDDPAAARDAWRGALELLEVDDPDADDLRAKLAKVVRLPSVLLGQIVAPDAHPRGKRH